MRIFLIILTLVFFAASASGFDIRFTDQHSSTEDTLLMFGASDDALPNQTIQKLAEAEKTINVST